MKFKFSLISFVFMTFVVSTLIDNTYASVEICFIKDGKTENITFDSIWVTFAAARKTMQLKPNDSFQHKGRVIGRTDEEDTLVKTTECNMIMSKHGESSIEVCIVGDRCTTIVLENSAKVNTLRDKLMESLPEYYVKEQCADIYFVNQENHVVQRSKESNMSYGNIMQTGVVTAYNKLTNNITDLDITWHSSRHRVRVNMDMPLSTLRYWITKPSACPNLKNVLHLPDKPLFPKPSNDLAENWLARDRYAELHRVPSYDKVSFQLVAPYNREKFLSVDAYFYKIESSPIPRLYYVDVDDQANIVFTGSRTDVFTDDNLTVKISSRSPKDKILLPMKDVRSTNSRAVSWKNVAIATNNTAVTITAQFDKHQPGYAYECDLFDHSADYKVNSLSRSESTNGICTFDFKLNKQQLTQNGEDISRFRYELGVAMSPHRPGHWSCDTRWKRETQRTGNIQLTSGYIAMGGAGNVAISYSSNICSVDDKEYAWKHKRSLRFYVFIFKSQEFADKVVEDLPVF